MATVLRSGSAPTTVRALRATLAVAALALGGCVMMDRGMDGSPRMARLPAAGTALQSAPLSAAERERMEAENARILREQEATIAAERRAYRAYRAYPVYPGYPVYPAYSVVPYVGSIGFHGHWGGRGRHRGGVGISLGFPGYYWGPGWW